MHSNTFWGTVANFWDSVNPTWERQMKCNISQLGTEFNLEWALTRLLLVAHLTKLSHIFFTKLLSIVSVAISFSDWLNVCYTDFNCSSSRHCIIIDIDLCFTHYFSNSCDIINNASEITQTLLWIHTHEQWTHTLTHYVFTLVRTRSRNCLHTWFLLTLIQQLWLIGHEEQQQY